MSTTVSKAAIDDLEFTIKYSNNKTTTSSQLLRKANVLYKAGTINDKQMKHILELKNNTVFHVASETVRKFSKDVKTFHDIILRDESLKSYVEKLNIRYKKELKIKYSTNEISKKEYDEAKESINSNSLNVIFDNAPLMVLSKDISKLIIFPNLPINAINNDYLKLCCWFSCYDVLDTLMKTYKDTKNAIKWKGIEKTHNTINKKLEVSIARALSRFTKFGKFLKDHEIRDMAVAIEDFRKPAQIVYCKTPEDYTKMYASGPRSCMTSGEERHWNFMKESGWHPTSFYYFYPHLQGIYIKHAGKVTARTILFEQNDKSISYSKIYSSNPEAKDRLKNALEEKGYKPRTHMFRRGAKFSIPANRFEDPKHDSPKYWCPIPYTEGIESSVSCVFNEDRKEFLFTSPPPLGKKNINISGSTSGYISEQQCLSSNMCSFCEKNIPHQGSMIIINETYKYCNCVCMDLQGIFVYAKGSLVGGPDLIVNKDSIIIDLYAQKEGINANFTTEHAIKRHNGFPIITTITGLLTASPDTKYGLTTGGIIIKYKDKDEFFRMPHMLLEDFNCNRYNIILGHSRRKNNIRYTEIFSLKELNILEKDFKNKSKKKNKIHEKEEYNKVIWDNFSYNQAIGTQPEITNTPFTVPNGNWSQL